MRFLKTASVVIAAMILIVSCGKKKTEVVIAEKSIPVTVAEVQPTDLEIEMIYTGTLRGSKEANVFASLPEAVVDLPVREGNYVKAGTPVIVLNKGGASSQYNQALAMFNQAKDNYEKFQNLYKQGAVSEQNYISAKTSFEIAEANFQSARQQVELTSPISGILTNLAVNIGEYVPIGISLATISQTKDMRLKIYVDANSAANIVKGQKAKVNVENLNENSEGFDSEVIAVSKSADPQTRLFQIEIQIANHDGQLKPGMFARAAIRIENLRSVLSVPKEAVFTKDGIYKVFVVKGDRAKETSIKTGAKSIDFYQIIDGLAVNDSVVMIGRNLIEDGSLVNIATLDNNENPASEEITEDNSEG